MRDTNKDGVVSAQEELDYEMTHPTAAEKDSQVDSTDYHQHHNRFGWRDDQYPGMRAGFA